MEIENKISVASPTIEKFIKEHSFYIPKYQRNYSWTKKNAETLLMDIFQNDDYYIGNVMISYHNSDLELVDGQQRIITIFLLLAAIKSILLKANPNEFDMDYLFMNDIPRINVDDRISDSYNKIFKYIFNDSEVIEDVKNINEYIVYDNYKKILSKWNISSILELQKKVSDCQLVVIDCTSSSLSPYDVFLNINTKGVKLTNADILKSKLFSFLVKDASFDKYKNSWQKVMSTIGGDNIDDYLSMYLSLFNSIKSKVSKKSIIDEFILLITSKEKAIEIINVLGNEESIFFKSYIAVVNGNYFDYLNDFRDQSIDMEAIFDSLSYIRKNKYVQFNITFVAMLIYCNNDEKKFISKNFHFIDLFIKFVFLYASFQSADNNSPSAYANSFISTSVSIMKDKAQMKKHIITLCKLFNVCQLKVEDQIIGSIRKLECKSNSKGLRISCSLVALIDEWQKATFYAEHFICVSSRKSYALKLGNIIPVKYDDYADATVEEKLSIYKTRLNSEPSIKKFVDSFRFDDVEKFINERTDNYLIKLVNVYNDILIQMEVI